jgi:hypothetical protein
MALLESCQYTPVIKVCTLEITYYPFDSPQKFTVLVNQLSRSRWFNGYRVCHLIQGSRVQTQPRAMDLQGRQKSAARLPSEGK